MIPGIIASSIVPDTFGAQTFTASGSFTVPAGITTISAVCIGGGASGKRDDADADGGRAGDLRYSSSISVTPGETLTITVGTGGAAATGTTYNSGSSSSIARDTTILLRAAGGANISGTSTGASTGIAGNVGGGNGGNGGSANATYAGGGGGAGGYSGAGGIGASGDTGIPGDGAGGGAGGGVRSTGTAGWGGGVGIWGEGTSGTGGAETVNFGSFGSSASGSVYFGSGGGGNDATSGTSTAGGPGAVRIVWGKQGADTAAYPSTALTNVKFVGYISGSGPIEDGFSLNVASIGIQTNDLMVMAVGNGDVSNDPYLNNFTLVVASDINASLNISYQYATTNVTSVVVDGDINSSQNYIFAVFRNVYSHSTSSKNMPIKVGGNASNINTTPQLAGATAGVVGVKGSLQISAAAWENKQEADVAVVPAGWTKIAAEDTSTGIDPGTLLMAYRIAPNNNAIAAADITNATTGANAGWRSYAISIAPGEYTTT